MHRLYEQQFLDWISPIEPAFFEGKLVLDAGCGIGRHAFFAARYGAKDVVAMDLSAAVETAFRNIGRLPNAHVIQADILAPPFARAAGKGAFDFIYSIGVLHHLPDPEAGFRSLVRCLRPGGTFFGWVYGYENNALVHRVIDPVRRRVTSRLPPPLRRRYWRLGAARGWEQIWLLRRSELERLFGPARPERFGPLTKSWVCVHPPPGAAASPSRSAG